MTIRIESFATDKKHLLNEAFRIRNSVFVKEMGISKYTEYDGLDDQAIHYLLFYNDKPVATLRWRETEAGIVIEKFAVLKKYRGKAIAALFLRNIVDELLISKKTLYLYTKEGTVKFFENNGFIKDKGNVAQSGLDVSKMIYKIKRN